MHMIEQVIIRQAAVTEKRAKHEQESKMVFEVQKSANKIEVRKAIKKLYNVEALKVNINNTKQKQKRKGRTIGFVSGKKIAIVTLPVGAKLEE